MFERKMDTRYVIYLILAGIFLTGCAVARPARIILPQATLERVEWTAEELKSDPAIRTLGATKEASFHLIHLKNPEKPHIHSDHDLTVFILSGKGFVHFKDRAVPLAPGDVVTIPRGEVHWAENADPKGTDVYAVFTPAFDGKDSMLVEE